MKIAIIGRNSFLGRNISKLARDRHQVILIGKEQYHPPRLSYKKNFNWSLITNADLIIHCVSAGVQRNSSISPASTMEINYEEPKQLLLKLQEFGYKGRVITFGSYSEIGTNALNIGFTEEAIGNHKNDIKGAYAQSKHKLTRQISTITTDLKHFHFIIPNMYGAGENSDRLFPYIRRNIISNKKLVFSDATQVRQFIHVSDISKLCVHLPENISSGIFNLGTEPISVKDAILIAISTFEQQLLKKAFYEFGVYSARNSESQFWILDDTKARKLLGWAPTISLTDGLSGY